MQLTTASMLAHKNSQSAIEYMPEIQLNHTMALHGSLMFSWLKTGLVVVLYVCVTAS